MAGMCAATVADSVPLTTSKTRILGAAYQRSIMLPNTIQPREFWQYASARSESGSRRIFNGWCHGRYAVYNAYFNRWNDERNVNVNQNDNDWNDNWWFAGVRNSLRTPPGYSGGVSFCASCLRQPPSILPTSVNGSDSRVYRLLSMALISQATFKKNLMASSFVLARWTICNFCGLAEYPAKRIYSNTSLNSSSIFIPSVNLSRRGKCWSVSCQNL